MMNIYIYVQDSGELGMKANDACLDVITTSLGENKIKRKNGQTQHDIVAIAEP